jgi:hypothetical protein
MRSFSVVFVFLGDALRSKMQRHWFMQESPNRYSRNLQPRDLLGTGHCRPLRRAALAGRTNASAPTVI